MTECNWLFNWPRLRVSKIFNCITSCLKVDSKEDVVENSLLYKRYVHKYVFWVMDTSAAAIYPPSEVLYLAVQLFSIFRYNF